jgi:hypothetical protein
MNYFSRKAASAGSLSAFVLAALMLTATFFGASSSVAAQRAEQARTHGRVVISDPQMLAAAENSQPGGELELVSSRPLGAGDRFGIYAPQATAPLALYSNITTFTGQGLANGGAAADPANAANTITTLVADDLTLARSATVSGFSFSVANFNTTAVSARPLIRFYRANGANGGPGTFLAGFNFNPISFSAGSVGIFNFNQFGIFAGFGTVWAGITFDNNGGATGATAAQLNNLGQGIYNPPTVGSSADLYFRTTSNGSFAASNPAGTLLTFNNPAAPANFGWELRTNASTAATVAIGGRVTNGLNGRGVADAVVTLTDSAGAIRSAQTNALGYYRFAEVTVGDTYVFRAQAKRLEFAAQVLNVTESLTELNFAGF